MHHRRFAFAPIAALVLLFSGLPAAAELPVALEPSVAIDREIGRGETHEYEVMATPGELVELNVSPVDVDIELAVIAPGGRELIAGATDYVRRIDFVAQKAGPYRVTLLAPEGSTIGGHYRIRRLPTGVSGPEATRRVAAQRSYLDGVVQLRMEREPPIRTGISLLTEALRAWRALGDRVGERDALYALGVAHALLTEHREALCHDEEALAIALQLGDLDYAAWTLGQMAAAHAALGDAPIARQLFEEAAALHETLGSRAGQASSLTGLGSTLFGLGRIIEARDCLLTAQSIDRDLDNRGAEVITLRALGLAYGSTGDAAASMETYDRALVIARESGNRLQEALLLNNIAVEWVGAGMWQKAIERFEEAAAIFAEIGQKAEETNTLNNIGSVYSLLGDPRKAIVYLARGLPISRAIGDRNREASALVNLGAMYAELQNETSANEYLATGLELARRVGNRRLEGLALRHIGRMEQKAGRGAAAIEHHTQALRIFREIGNPRGEAHTVLSLATSMLSEGPCENARASVDDALAIARRIVDRPLEAAALAAEARLDRDEGRLFEAGEEIAAALDIVESLRAATSIQQLRVSYLATVRDQYELNVDILMRLHEWLPGRGYDARALEMSERARARVLLEAIEEARAGIRSHADPSLIARELEVRRRLDDKAASQARLLGNRPTEAKAAGVAAEIEDLTEELIALEDDIRRSNPRYGSLMQPESLTLRQIQEQLSDPDTVLLVYALGEERSYLWAVGNESLQTFDLPAREEIETLAREVHDRLAARPRSTGDGALAAKLSAMVLGPAASALRRRIVIVAEGALQYVPFAALPAPGSRDALVVDHEIVSIPSVSALAALRRERNRPPAGETVMIVADPVFSADDSRVAGRSSGVRGAPAELARSSATTSTPMPRMPRLPLTRWEAESIARLLPHSTRTVLDFQASKAFVSGGEIGRHRIVHFATHGILNGVHPELSGIVLSLVDEQGRPQDGFLRLYDVYNLDLSADLVVLSACQTALGKDVRGEGLIGLTRGFMHAGAPRIVASLWRVDDRATAMLMQRFYEAMLGPSRLPPAAALRAAQLELSRTRPWSDPYYWAAFILQGEWR
jgi:CHAT domain-containing protein/tetratricopeptide (TPR) repeat protein